MLEILTNLLWGWHVLLLILLIGICFSFQSGFFQIRRFSFWIKSAFSGGKNEGGTTAFQALTAALGGSIGTGNIVGVGVAIAAGGPGAVLWMWVSAVFGMMTIFAENMLSVKYRDSKMPGPLGYISNTHKIGKKLAVIYAVGAFLSSFGMGNMVQVNAAGAALNMFGIPVWVSAVFLSVMLFFVAKGGLKFAVKITEKLVPLMSVMFFIAAGAVLWITRENLPAAFSSIFEGAFSLKAGAGGTIGMLIAMKTGVSRGVFTNEAGLGSSSFAYAEVEGRSAVEIGCMGIFQVFADTILMCTVTALCILCCFNPQKEGAELVFYAFTNTLGEAGGKAVSICTALFAAATAVTWCCYGRAGLFYLTKEKGRLVYAGLFAAAAFSGCFMPLGAVFQIGDIFNGMMAIPNILALFCFSGELTELIRRFERNRKNNRPAKV
jgi:amino acid carrier protein